MIAPLYLLLLSIINGPIRGASDVWYSSKGMAALYVGILTGLLAYYYGQMPLDCGIIGAITTAGMWLGFLLGWSPFLGAAINGWQWATKAKVFTPFRWFASKIQPHVVTEANARRWGVAGFTARALEYYPTFLGLAYYNRYAPIFGLLVFTKGFVYGATRYIKNKEKYNPVRIAEYLYPLAGWGLALTLTIVSL